MKNGINFRTFGTMIDCSRNAVMKVDALKKWIDITSDLGYNAVMLYTEDTYEIEENSYFGYLRGKYSKSELKEIDRYARGKGMEVIPCIQTLAHMNAILRWPAYSQMVDTDDILLAGDERVYTLIDKMFKTISECFTTKTVNIGMDEAYMVGRGKYYDIHGDTKKIEVLTEHLNRVAELGKKYGLKLIMWSDMFFRLFSKDYYSADADFCDEIREKIPENVELIYWDYYSTSKSHYDSLIQNHRKLGENTWFAGGLWTWIGYAPHNEFSLRTTENAFKSCTDNGVKDVFLTLWGDDGGECSRFALLPSLFAASEFAKGNYSLTDIKLKFKEKYGIAFDRFMLLDLLDGPNNDKGPKNPEKYLLFNDPFMGMLDSTLKGNEAEGFAKCKRKLSLMKKNEEWGYLFDSLCALCDVLALKADLGQRTRAAYEKRDTEEINQLINDYKTVIKKLRIFYDAYRKQWYAENKPQGFEVQDIRIGGLLQRMENCRERLVLLNEGKIDKIEELEEKLLDMDGKGEEFSKNTKYFQCWYKTVTPGVISHCIV